MMTLPPPTSFMSPDEHAAIGCALFIARNQLIAPIGPAIFAIRPAKLKKQVLRRREALIRALEDLRAFLEEGPARRAVGPCRAFDLYYRPVVAEEDLKTLRCPGGGHLAEVLRQGIKEKICGGGRFTAGDSIAISSFVETAIIGKLEIPLMLLAARMTNRNKKEKFLSLCAALTASRTAFTLLLITTILPDLSGDDYRAVALTPFRRGGCA